MNDIFDFGRFGKLFLYECTNYLPRYVKGVAIFVSFIVAAWLITIAGADPMYSRTPLIAFLFNMAMFLSPYFIYKDINNRKKGYSYAMIPASTAEKLLSMSIICMLVVPVFVYAALTLSDFALYGLSSMGIGYFMDFELCNPFSSLDESTPAGISFLALLSSVPMAMMFNSIFRKNKILKTVLFNMAVSFVAVIVAIIVAQFISSDGWIDLGRKIERFFDAYTFEEVECFYSNVVILWSIFSILVSLVITYFRIKRVNY